MSADFRSPKESGHKPPPSVLAPTVVFGLGALQTPEEYRQRKVAVITGVTGQDGSYLAELLLGKGYEVHGV